MAVMVIKSGAGGITDDLSLAHMVDVLRAVGDQRAAAVAAGGSAKWAEEHKETLAWIGVGLEFASIMAMCYGETINERFGRTGTTATQTNEENNYSKNSNPTGSDWNEFLKNKYGVDNVEWATESGSNPDFSRYTIPESPLVKPIATENTKPYTNSRPAYGPTQVEDVWNNFVNPETGKVIDPSGETITWNQDLPRNGQWDMGHIPGEKYADIYEQYIDGIMSKDKFLEWYRNPNNYRPELPSTNRSHLYE